MGRARIQKAEFEVLKQGLVLRQLDDTPRQELHAVMMQEAEGAAVLAGTTQFPFLVFPCLFAERARVASELFQKELSEYWQAFDS
jgi:hypothetical protein